MGKHAGVGGGWWMLLGTGLDGAAAVLIASGQLEPPAELCGLANALQAGWLAEEDPT